MNATPPPSSRRWTRWILGAALLVGLAFRLAGLSHDLADGYVYHPDTPKQMRAVERFLQGTYYYHTGRSDYDGYPLFHAHLVEYGVRAFSAVANPIAAWMGLRPGFGDPDMRDLYWLARLLSVGLATLLIVVVFRIGSAVHSRAAGLMAAWLLALSPVDVAAAHYETGDATASFFATLTVLLAVRVYQRGWRRDYVFAALSGLCAFAAKYHAGMALIPVGLAHLLRQRDVRAVFAPASLRMIGLLAVTAIAGLFLTIPSMFTHAGTVLEEIWAFLHHVSRGRSVPEDVLNAGFAGRFLFSMQRNLPILASLLSWPVCGCVLAGFYFFARPERRIAAILYALPLVYFVLGVTLRPAAHPIYHTMMTPVLFVIAGFVLARAPRLVAALLLAVALGQLGWHTGREALFFQHRDTRRVSGAWAAENLPRSLEPRPAAYAFDLSGYGASHPGPSGRLAVLSSFRSQPAPRDHVLLQRFDLGDLAISHFRNPTIEVFVQSDAIREDFTMPAYQRVASLEDTDLVFEPTTEFLRSSRIAQVARDRALRRTVVAHEPLDGALAVVRNGRRPARAVVSIGGHAQRVSLAPGETQVALFDALRASPLSGGGLWFYRWHARTSWGRAQVALAFSAEEKGVLLFNQGRYADALPWLLQACDARPGHPTLSAMALLAAFHSGQKLAEEQARACAGATAWLEGTVDDDSVARHTGLSPAYLRALPYLAWEAEELRRSGLSAAVSGSATILQAPATNAWTIRTHPLFLDAGCYTLSLCAQASDGAAHATLAVKDGDGATLWSAPVDLPAGDAHGIPCLDVPVAVPEALNEGYLEVTGPAGCAVAFDRLALAPDATATLRAMGEALRLARDGTWARQAASPLLYRPLLAQAARLQAAGRQAEAFEAWREAARLRPDALEPVEGMASLRDGLDNAQHEAQRAAVAALEAGREARDFVSAPANFRGGLRLLGCRVRDRQLRPGSTFGLNLYWSLDDYARDASRWIAWVHVEDANRKTLLYADRPLLPELERTPEDARLLPPFWEVAVPANLPPGEYRVLVGVYRPGDNKRLKVAATDLPQAGKGVYLPLTLTVTR